MVCLIDGYTVQTLNYINNDVFNNATVLRGDDEYIFQMILEDAYTDMFPVNNKRSSTVQRIKKAIRF